MARSVSKTIRVGPVATFFLGVLLCAVGYWLKGFVAGLDEPNFREMGAKVAIGLMIIGGIFSIGNLLWGIFIVIVAANKPSQGQQ